MERDMNKIIAICAAQIYLWEQERQIHAICDCARERGYEVMIYNLSVKMDVETSHSRGELSVFSVIPYDQLAALVVLGDMDSTDTVPFNISHRLVLHCPLSFNKGIRYPCKSPFTSATASIYDHTPKTT